MTEAAKLVSSLVAIDSVNPSLVDGGAGEENVARYVAGWLKRADLEVTVDDAAPGRPLVIGRVRGRGDGPTLLLNAHTDTVSVEGMERPHEPRIDGDRLRGRGAYDMKGGLAAAMLAAASLRGLAGDVFLAAVPDEEAGGMGTRRLLELGHRFDAAIIPEPTDLDIAIAHKGFVGFEIETHGRAAHGSRPDQGIDAIAAMGPVLTEIAALDRRLREATVHPTLGSGSIHASVIDGGQEFSTYPAHCRLQGEWRTLPGQDSDAGLGRLAAAASCPADLRIVFRGDPFEVDVDRPIVKVVQRHAGTELVGMPYWTDAALLGQAGVPTVLYGPAGGGAHAIDEWVDLWSVERVRDVLIHTATEFCGSA